LIKDIVVNLESGERTSACDYAVSLAATFGAHLVGIVFRYDPIIPISSVGYIPADAIETQERESRAAAQAAVDHFVAANERAGVAAEPRTISASTAPVSMQFGQIARRFDLAVVGQADPNAAGLEGSIAEGALFESGRPVVVVPYIQKASLKLDRVMVCWDGSRAAARAVADAVALLERAGCVEVVIVANERGKQDEIEGVGIGEHLARHGLKVEITRIALGDIDVADVILSHAADAGSDLMVMGGYGHSRLREFVLGGVTRAILRSMTTPVLMSH
jgi:nucleotide-binding universal stress UspA family protein